MKPHHNSCVWYIFSVAIVSSEDLGRDGGKCFGNVRISGWVGQVLDGLKEGGFVSIRIQVKPDVLPGFPGSGDNGDFDISGIDIQILNGAHHKVLNGGIICL